MKKSLFMFFLIVLLLLSTSCSNSNKTTTTNDEENSAITILMPDDIAPGIQIDQLFKATKGDIERDLGIKIEIEKITASNKDDYMKKKNTKLYQVEGPTLIYVPYYDTYDKLIEQGIALNIRDKIPNLQNVYDGLSNDYFVPISMKSKAIALRKNILDEIGIEAPELNWTMKEFFSIYDRWLEKYNPYMSSHEFPLLVERLLSNHELSYFNEDGELDLCNDNQVRIMKKIREEVFSGKYILYDNYDSKNYYKMLFETDSEEFKETDKYWLETLDNHFFVFNEVNILNTINTHTFLENHNEFLLYPLPELDKPKIISWGFIVNSNGKNIDAGIKFLDYLLSEEVQLKLSSIEEFLVEGGYFAPANKNIENINNKDGAVISEEAKSLRNYILDNYDNSQAVNNISEDMKLKIRDKYHRLIAEIAFSDEPFSDEEIRLSLKKVENELNIYLNE